MLSMRCKTGLRSFPQNISRQGKFLLGNILLAICFGGSLSGDPLPPLCWDSVTVDCLSRAHRATGYRIFTAYLDPNFYPCSWTICDDQGENCHDVQDRCPAYSLSAWGQGPDIPDTGTARTCTTWDLPTPPPDTVIFYQVVGCYGGLCAPFPSCGS
jgi:hypothetical protein